LFDTPRDAESVHGLEAQGLEDEHVERPLDNVGAWRIHELPPESADDAQTVSFSHLDCQDVTIRVRWAADGARGSVL
jgi:hypothetical protein